MKVAVFGTTGMLGHVVASVLESKKFNVMSVNRDKIDAQFCSVNDIQYQIDGVSWAINCIGLIKPYIHDDNPSDVQKAISINALFPYKLAEAANRVNAKVIQIATDCVYDGQKGSYLETDNHNAIDVYGKTKSLGEVRTDNLINLRCSVIGRESKSKSSLLEWFLNQPVNAKIDGYKNHLWNGVTTVVFAKTCAGIMRNNILINAVQHLVPANTVTKAEMLREFKKIFHRSDIVIEDIFANTGIDRTLVTGNSETNEIIWNAAGYKRIPTIQEMVREI
ncbi:MAG: SDR family oxidoreductase [Holosporaceae bacterium]|jgi:dTDP-4-dehydrorhamnose reductase|nr:SDR family oxidoreductase [Holosporaceae bacterium]